MSSVFFKVDLHSLGSRDEEKYKNHQFLAENESLKQLKNCKHNKVAWKERQFHATRDEHGNESLSQTIEHKNISTE